MGLPGHRRTSSHKRRRASHFALKAKSLTICLHCKASSIPHQVCKTCGYYRGRQVIKMKSKLSSRTKVKDSKTEEKS